MNNNLENLPGWKVWCLEHLSYRMAIFIFGILELLKKYGIEILAYLWIGSVVVGNIWGWSLIPLAVFAGISALFLLIIIAFLVVYALVKAIEFYNAIAAVFRKQMEQIPERKDKKDD